MLLLHVADLLCPRAHIGVVIEGLSVAEGKREDCRNGRNNCADDRKPDIRTGRIFSEKVNIQENRTEQINEREDILQDIPDVIRLIRGIREKIGKTQHFSAFRNFPGIIRGVCIRHDLRHEENSQRRGIQDLCDHGDKPDLFEPRVPKTHLPCEFAHQISAREGHESAPCEFFLARVDRHFREASRFEQVDDEIDARRNADGKIGIVCRGHRTVFFDDGRQSKSKEKTDYRKKFHTELLDQIPFFRTPCARKV